MDVRGIEAPHDNANKKEIVMNRMLNNVVRNVTKALTNSFAPSASAATFEALESRQHLSATTLAINVQQTDMGPTLVINGSNRSDRITVSQTSRGITVSDSTGTTLVRNRVNLITVNGVRGNDRINISSSVKCGTIIDGGAGDDVIRGGSGRDTIFAGSGNDRIYGNAGNDVLAGMTGNDSIYGGAGKDLLIGGAGDDVLVAVGGGGNDSLEGDAGFDSFWMDDAMYETVLDAISYDEQYNMAVHRVDAFLDYTDANGRNLPISNELAGQNLPDPGFQWDDSGYYNADGYDNFLGLPLFSSAGASVDDLNQGAVGSCYFLSTLGAVAYTNPLWIEQSIVDFGDGTFGVRFIDDSGSQEFVRVDADLPIVYTQDGGVMPAYDGLGNEGSLWAPLMEKAWTFARDHTNSTDPIAQTSYHNISGGWLDEVFVAMGGVDAYKTEANESPLSSGDEMLGWMLDELAAGNALTYATGSSPIEPLVSLHAYTVLGVMQGGDGDWYLMLRNPWGVDGHSTMDGKDDGYIFVNANDAFSSMMQVGVATV
ncbi:hypothetical protein BH09PLA1_BH09PLA1_26130 [soil metagenome]